MFAFYLHIQNKNYKKIIEKKANQAFTCMQSDSSQTHQKSCQIYNIHLLIHHNQEKKTKNQKFKKKA